MSLIITLYIREGIVMASDSRLTLKTSREQSKEQEKRIIRQMAVAQSDSIYKTFLTPQGLGISTFGAAEIKGMPIAGYIESFITEELAGENIPVDQVPGLIKEYFSKMEKDLNVGFHVAGYKKRDKSYEQHVWRVDVGRDEIMQINEVDQPGLSWAGEGDIISRLVKRVSVHDEDGEDKRLPYYQIPYGFFTLQDAIDFSIYAVRTTIESLRFQPRPKTVGGPIDVLVIKPERSFWVKRKELEA